MSDNAAIAAQKRQLLIESFVCLAHQVTRRYRHRSLERDDIFQIAMLAVIEAVDTYDPSIGPPLGAYVATRIRWAWGEELKRLERHCRSTGALVGDVADESCAAEDAEDHTELWDAIETLPVVDQSILVRTFGLDDYPVATTRKLGLFVGVSRQTISNSRVRSIESLRVALSA
jgi:RNA polymerase sigma factor (sigma-70 family)